MSKVKVAILQATTVAEVITDQHELVEPVSIHEGGDFSAEDTERQMAVIHETTPDEVPTIDDVQVGCNDDHLTPDQVKHVKNTIWRRSHLCMGKGTPNQRQRSTLGATSMWAMLSPSPSAAERCRQFFWWSCSTW